MVNYKFKDNLGSDLMITSEFGEYLLGYYLVKKGCFVVRANTEGCDLFVMDKKGDVFKKKKNSMVGIEVKTRQNFAPSFMWDSFNTLLSKKEWNFKPYLAIITPKEIAIIPVELTKSRRIQTKRGAISLSKIKNLRFNQKFRNKIILLDWRIPIENKMIKNVKNTN